MNNTEDVERNIHDFMRKYVLSCKVGEIASHPGTITRVEEYITDSVKALIQQEANHQKAELLDRLSAIIEPFSHSDSQNSNDALGFVLTTIEAERKKLEEGLSDESKS